ncbi:adenine deaminase [Paraflavitalea sp. CAU 1676]|uniref:adenine deaminase n=1 Tax=Paraflavitalea sp. CAU 1676 TaxID=3032598 RepID=UPI0023DAA5DE|nr:adenine deaminase [Paraflavitalea sp. CAU 1676]MDF2193039.1 adenine deaminase [Paraflavitalea sp. CAU 1676]
MTNFSITGFLADVWQQKVYPASIRVEAGIIRSIDPLPAGAAVSEQFILPGFIDSHVHIESSMLVPAEFARLAVVHGTVATVSDPHEIANVCGLAGVQYMIDNGNTTPFKFYFGAPSCVPATIFETAGATLDVDDVEALLQMDEVKYLSEMMNFPGVLFKDPVVMAKIAAARRLGKPIDGHAPGLRGEQAKQYIEAGISTDHECFTEAEALDKLHYGMKILIREGSAARNFEALIGLLHDHPEQIMFCSDDKHPDSLVEGHIDQLCARAVAKGIDLFKVLQAACVNPVLHYHLDVGLLRVGDRADFILVKDVQQFTVKATFIDGIEVTKPEVMQQWNAAHKTNSRQAPVNNFHGSPIKPEDLRAAANEQPTVPVIEALDGQLITNRLDVPASWLTTQHADWLTSNTDRDILKIAVVNRYHPAPPAIGFIKNFGLKAGALASSVAHDSHNIVAVGADDESLCQAINLVIARQGGVSCCKGDANASSLVVGLPVGGLMSDEDGYAVARSYTAIDAMAKELGSTLSAPFMTLSFMALLVIPHLKLSDLGMFDGDQFALL